MGLVSFAFKWNPLSISAGNSAGVGGAGANLGENEPQFDQSWVEQRQKKALLKLEKLDTDLKNYKSNSIKVSSFLDFSSHTYYIRRGSEFFPLSHALQICIFFIAMF